MSLQQRLNRGLVIILSLIFVIHWLAADWVIRAVAEKEMLTRLTHNSDSLLDAVSTDAGGQVTFDASHVGFDYEQAFSGHYFVVHLDDQVFYSPSLQGQPLLLGSVRSQSVRKFHFAEGPKQQPLLVLSRGFDRFGHHISISTAEDLTEINYDISGIRLVYLGWSFLALMVSIALQTADVKHSLRPLIAVRVELEAIAEGNQKQITTLVPSEIEPLVQEINLLLRQVERRLHKSRTAIGNLAHALQRPLAMLFRLAEDPVLQKYPELLEQLQQQNNTLSWRINRELKHARISGSVQAGAAFNPHKELTALAQLLKNIYSDKQLDIQINAPDQLMRFDREDMLELTGNLLDNACKWAKRQIEVDVTYQNGVAICVADDGPGCSEDEMPKLARRGLRLDEAIQGHGLGLGIVRDITQSYGGTLQIARDEKLGGLLVTVNFPVQVIVQVADNLDRRITPSA